MPFQICRVCYKRGYNLLSLENDIHRYQYKLLSCVPEIDIYIIDNPGICKKCADMLDTAFELRETCLKNEMRYNSTFNTEKKVIPEEKESTVIQKNAHIDNEANIKETCNERNQICKPVLNSECTEDENLLEIGTEFTLFCNICNIEFTSHHDKKVHDHKLHRQLKHFRKFKELLPPINKNIESTLPTTQLKYSPENISSNCAPNTNKNNGTPTIRSMDKNIVDNTYSKTLNQKTDLIQIIENFVCTQCKITFVDTCEMQSHYLTHVKYLCQICGKNFETRSDLDKHMRLHLTKCCGESFPTATLLQLHTYKEHNTTCGICDEKFIQFSILFDHLLDHMGDNWHKCNFCGKQFKEIEKMENHSCKYYTCDECKTIYFTKKGYITHIQIHKQEPLSSDSLTVRKYVSCSRCNASFKTRSLYVQHYNSIHLEKQKHSDIFIEDSSCYSCQLCSKQYQLYTHLKMHILQIHCNRKLTIPVVDCRKDDFYKEQEGLKINFEILPKYMEKSTNKFTILKKELSNRSKRICFKCRIMFSSRLLFFSHAKQKHQSCCNTKFTCLTMIISHNFTHYNQKEKEGSHEEITCAKCARAYRNYTSLLSHSCSSFIIMKSPVESKHFECMIERQQNILDSVRKQNNDKKFKCSSCKKNYSNYTSLVTHSCSTSCAISKQQVGHEIFTCTIEDHDDDDSDTNEDSTKKIENLTAVICEICKKEFDCKASLLQHIKVHI